MLLCTHISPSCADAAHINGETDEVENPYFGAGSVTPPAGKL